MHCIGYWLFSFLLTTGEEYFVIQEIYHFSFFFIIRIHCILFSILLVAQQAMAQTAAAAQSAQASQAAMAAAQQVAAQQTLSKAATDAANAATAAMGLMGALGKYNNILLVLFLSIWLQAAVWHFSIILISIYTVPYVCINMQQASKAYIKVNNLNTPKDY